MTLTSTSISRSKAWLLAIRPQTLPAVIGPLVVGNALALTHRSLPVQTEFSLTVALLTLCCGLLLQIAVNLANDYFDHQNGVDTHERLGPYPLASHGLGELTVFIFFGLVAVVGSFYLQSGSTSIEAWLLGAAIGLLNAAIMLVNNTRDIATDANAGKHTLAVRIGLAQSRVLYQTLVYLPYGLIISAFLLGYLPGLAVLLAGLSLIFARRLSRQFYTLDGAALIPLLGQTALLTLVFSLLFSLGWYLSLPI